MDYKKLGLKAGIEVHNQLDTHEKLFCSCVTAMRGDKPLATIIRKQHPVASELGEYDIAAQYEVIRDRIFVYEAFKGETCQVEMDEEPPHPLNQEALETAITVALMMNCKIPDEIHVMRKTVIDGSNTTSFQRTMVVGMGGFLKYRGKKIPIDQVSLEEDAAAIVREEDGVARYRLNRLGVPLIEVSTGLLEGLSPKEIEDAALLIGTVVRSTGKAKKVIGAIRQDLNVSIKGGARNELKGIQELGMLSKSIENEINRQLSIMWLRDELKKRGVKKLHDSPVSVTSVLSGTKNKILRAVVEGGGDIYAVSLPKFVGLLRKNLFEGKTLGREFADVAVAFGLKGLFHSDEDLSKYNLEGDFNLVRDHLKLRSKDALIILGDDKTQGRAAKEVLERARSLLIGVQEGTRSVTSDGSTKFNRPLPGARRMYPETDIEPVPIRTDLLKLIKKNLPELLPEKMKRIKSKYNLSDSLVGEISRSNFFDVFEEAVLRSKADSSVIANTFVSIAKDLSRREGVDIGILDNEKFFDLFDVVGSGNLTKEAIPDVLRYLVKSPGKSVEEAISNLNLKMLSETEIEKITREIAGGQKIPENKLTGLVMSKVRGRASPQIVIKIVKKFLRK